MSLSLFTLAVHVHCITHSQSNDVFYDVFSSFHSHPIFFFFLVGLCGLAEESDPDDVSRFCLEMNVIVTVFKLLKVLCAGAICPVSSANANKILFPDVLYERWVVPLMTYASSQISVRCSDFSSLIFWWFSLVIYTIFAFFIWLVVFSCHFHHFCILHLAELHCC